DVERHVRAAEVQGHGARARARRDPAQDRRAGHHGRRHPGRRRQDHRPHGGAEGEPRRTGRGAWRAAGADGVMTILAGSGPPAISSIGVTRNANATSLKLAQFVVLVTTPLIGSASRHPTTPPNSAITADSARKLASTLRGWKPSVSSTAISGVRELTAAYIVF